jgi:hypothetical protein
MTGEEIWMIHFTHLNKFKKRMQWKHLTFLTAKKFKVCQSAVKVMVSASWDAEGVINVEIMHGSKIINTKAYCYML